LIVLDASSIVGAALKRDSTPESALLWAEESDIVALSADEDAETANVLARPKFAGAIPTAQRHRIMAILRAGGRPETVILSETWYHIALKSLPTPPPPRMTLR
jgi:predicted nucleic acid-binding protein